MKRKVMILMTVILLMSSGVFAQGVSIDSEGNINAGAANGSGSLEVIGESGSDGIVSTTTGIGTAVHGANLDAGGFAGYFDGNAEVTGNLNVQGTISGESDPTVNALGKSNLSCADGQIVMWNGGISSWQCATNSGGGGSVTSVNAGNGLSGNSTTGDLTLDVNFSGTGSADTAAKSDHNHDGNYSSTTHNHDASYYTQAEVDTMLASRDEAISTLQTQVADLLLKVGDKLAKVTVSGDGNDLYITGANLHVESGSGTTDGAVNGLGNIIVGYNENRAGSVFSCSVGQFTDQPICETNGGTWAISHKSGSHNLVVGKNNNYSSYGGIVSAFENEISAPYATVTGGEFNIASNAAASITGGKLNIASGYKSSISGGESNTASGVSGHVAGGVENISSGDLASISGGVSNIASGLGAHVSGGGNFNSGGNEAFADHSAILGGSENIAGDPSLLDHSTGQMSTVSGGRSNVASGFNASVSGGWDNTASGQESSVSGGWDNTASGQDSSVSGGSSRSAAGIYWWAAGDILKLN